jgi:hypothetical protein
MTDPLSRIADALERIAPPPRAAADPSSHPAYVWHEGILVAARKFAPLRLSALVGIDGQKAALVRNFERLAAGYAAQDVLLWGARGTGKSALVKSALAHVQGQGGNIALVSVPGDALGGLPRLLDQLAPVDRNFAVFVDDLGFDAATDARALRSLLEGGVEARPDNARLVVTSNRRHLLPRDIADQSSAINPRDTIDDELALVDRFGLSIGFHVIDQDHYVAIVRGYAEAHQLDFDAAEAVRWATQRGSRSGRVAWQYIVDLAGRSGQQL